MDENILEIKNLSKNFALKKMVIKAVSNFSLDIIKGETVGLVGESGCGKSTLGRLAVGLHHPTTGKVFFNGINVHDCRKEQRQFLFRKMQMIFQDTGSSLNPRMTVGQMLMEPISIHGLCRPKEMKERVGELMELVGMDRHFVSHYPHQLSGGQRQRVGIARALSVEPQFVVCDEPISSLDVSMQAQIVNLLKELQQGLNLSLLFISHNLSMVRYISHRVAVMYLGHLVELATNKEIYSRPAHPYTQGLHSSLPEFRRLSESRTVLDGEPPSAVSTQSGCVFSSRCSKAGGICFQETPLLKEISAKHFVACHLYETV